MRLALGFIGRARGVKQAVQLHRAQCLVQPMAALAGGNGQPVLARLQHLQQLQHAVEQRNVVLVRQVVVAVTRTQLRVFFFRQIGRRMGQRRHQAHAYDVGSLLVAGHRSAQIAHRGLDAARDDLGGIEQRAIPVEGDEVKTAWCHGGLESGTARWRICIVAGQAPPRWSKVGQIPR